MLKRVRSTFELRRGNLDSFIGGSFFKTGIKDEFNSLNPVRLLVTL